MDCKKNCITLLLHFITKKEAMQAKQMQCREKRSDEVYLNTEKKVCGHDAFMYNTTSTVWKILQKMGKKKKHN